MHPVRDLYFMARSVLVIADMIGDTLKREWLIQGEEGMSRGVLNNNNFQGHIDRQAHCILEALELFKKVVQQGRSHFCAQSVLPVREHGKMGRTPLAAFFNSPSRYPEERTSYIDG